jgi:large subunit ribosomal protein L10
MRNKAEKKAQAEELRTQLANVSTVILSTFQGITVEQDTQLRRAVEGAGGHYEVVKNRVAMRAAEGTPAEGLLKGLKGTNSIAYTKTDPVTLAKILTKVAKDVPAFQFRAGWVEGRVMARRRSLCSAKSSLPMLPSARWWKRSGIAGFCTRR